MPATTTAASRRLPFDGEDVVAIQRGDDTGVRSVNMAATAEERHHRYLARAARHCAEEAQAL